MSAALLSLDKVKALLGLPATPDPVSDAKLTAALPVITEYFEGYCKRGLAFVADVIEDMRLVARLPLFRFPLDPLKVAVVIDGAAPVLPLIIDAARGFVHLGYAYAYPCAASIARVTYDGGYPEDEVPADLALAYARCCADFGGVVYTSGTGGGGAPLKSLGLGSGALTVSFDTTAEAGGAYDTSAVPPILAPYLFTLEHYRMKDFC